MFLFKDIFHQKTLLSAKSFKQELKIIHKLDYENKILSNLPHAQLHHCNALFLRYKYSLVVHHGL